MHHHFTKTGSGQTYEKLRKKWRFSQGKDISGAGCDTNIIGRGAYETVPGKPWQQGYEK
jgi:hypothetical protein